MGWYCRICGRARAHERFTGKGHRDHICRDCALLPKDEIRRIDAKCELVGYLWQSNISARNLARLDHLATWGDPEVAELADLVREIANVKSHRRRRMGLLERERPDLVSRLDAAGLLEALTEDFGL